jgi:uncharacterized protein (TIGR02594 family)
MFETKSGAIKKICAEVESYCGREPKGEPTGIMPKILPFLYKEKPIALEKQHGSFNRRVLLLAIKEIGIKQVTGSKSNPVVVKYYSYARTRRSLDPIKWGASFVSYCIEKSGEKSIDCNSSIAFKDWGIKSVVPVSGDIVVFKEQCGVLFGSKDENAIVIGAFKDNEVSIEVFPWSEVLATRRAKDLTLEEIALIESEMPTLKKALS